MNPVSDQSANSVPSRPSKTHFFTPPFFFFFKGWYLWIATLIQYRQTVDVTDICQRWSSYR